MAKKHKHREREEGCEQVRYEDGKRLVRRRSLLGGPGWGFWDHEPHPTRGDRPPGSKGKA